MNNVLKIDANDDRVRQYFFKNSDRPFPNKDAAEANRNAILAEYPWMEMDALGKAAHDIANENASVKAKAGKLIKLIDKVGAAIATHSPCRKGCSNCCNIATVAFTSEAERIGQFIGRKPVQIKPRHPDEVRKIGEQFYKQPCPFLKDNACSIYEVRPFSCRQHHSLDNDASQCDLDIPSEQSSVPSYSGVKVVELIYCATLVRSDALADIREFFPQERK